MRGHDDYRDLRPLAVQALQQLQAVKARHAYIADDRVWSLAAKACERRGAVVEHLRMNSFLFEGLLEDPADGPVIIDDPDAIIAS